MATTKTVILGGGFGGIAAANRLRSLVPPENEITLVDKTSHFHVGAGNTWVMLGERSPDQIMRSRKDLLSQGIRLLEENVLKIDIEQQTVATGEESLRWDYLVIALGADLNLASVPGLAESAHTFYTTAGATRLKTALDGFSGGDLALLIPRAPFKCPPAPYEAAMLLHHLIAKRGLEKETRIAIYTIEGAPMATAGPEMGQYIRGELSHRGIAFHPQKKTVRVDPATHRVVFEDGSDAHYDLLIAIPPHEAPQVVREAGLTNTSGWIPVDPLTLKIGGGDVDREVYAVGDITTVPLPGRYRPDMALVLPKAGIFAEAHGQVVAHQIAMSILGKKPGATFDGEGFCYLELGGGLAVKANGSFFATPHPVMQKQTPDEKQRLDKEAWVARYLNAAG